MDALNLKSFDNNLLLGDCLIELKKLPDNSVDSIITDPPYGISFMNKKWDHSVPSIEVWKECLRVLKPGGHMLVACGTRTQHQMVTPIEDAGFEIRDVITWLYGSGFPKSLNISKAIDKEAGAEREVVGKGTSGETRAVLNAAEHPESFGGDFDITAPATEATKHWDGWGTALKPACEFWTLCRKPIEEKTIAKNVLKHGTGGLNIDACRVAVDAADVGDINRFAKSGGGGFVYKKNELEAALARGETKAKDGCSISHALAYMELLPEMSLQSMQKMASLGRFPANLILDEEAAAALDEQSGANNSRFFKTFENESSIFYCPKASQSEKSKGLSEGQKASHPTVKPVKLMEYLCRLITPPFGVVLDPFMGSGSTGVGAINEGFGFIGIEMTEEYFNIATQRIGAAK